MCKIVWDNSFSVDIPEIDLEHMQLLEMINELNSAVLENKGVVLLGKILSGLVEYAEKHFKTEEKYFEKFDYQEKKRHVSEHKIFLQKVSEIIDKFGEDNLCLPEDTLNFMSEWLKDHIKGTDKSFSKQLKEKL